MPGGLQLNTHVTLLFAAAQVVTRGSFAEGGLITIAGIPNYSKQEKAWAAQLGLDASVIGDVVAPAAGLATEYEVTEFSRDYVMMSRTDLSLGVLPLDEIPNPTKIGQEGSSANFYAATELEVDDDIWLLSAVRPYTERSGTVDSRFSICTFKRRVLRVGLGSPS